MTEPVPYTRTNWVDGSAGGTPMNAARLNNCEQGIVNVAAVVSDLVDAVNALQAGKAPTKVTAIQGGPTSARPAPVIDTVYRDYDLGKVIYGTGSAWVYSDGTAVVGAGSSNAPQNFAAVTQPDNSILCTWNAVPNATTYKLYETNSPTGVTGATALTTTSTSRSPGTVRTYEYWVTATVAGVESAASNHGIAVIPYAPATGAGPTAGSPAELLKIGGTGGYWNEGIGRSSGHVDIPQSQLLAGYSESPYFMLNPTATAVQFQVYMNGATTSANTHYARSEMRELTHDGNTKAAWVAGSGSHIMEYSFKVLHIQPNKPWTTIGQIHDASSDALSIKVKGNSTSALEVTAWIYDAEQSTRLVTPFVLNSTTTKIKIDLTNGTLKIYANDVLKITSTAMSGKGSGHYFKVGDYAQSHYDYGGNENPSEYCQVEVWGLTVTHSPAL